MPPDRSSGDDALIVLTSGRLTRQAVGQSGVVLADLGLAGAVPAERRWAHPHVWWVVAQLLERESEPEPGVHRRAVVAKGAVVHPTARLRPGAVVRGGARIGAGCDIGENAVIYERVILGRDVVIGPGAVIGRPGFGWASGPGGQTVRIPQLGGVVVDDEVEVGALCTIDAGTLGPTWLGRGSKLDAQVHVGHNGCLGEGVLIAAQVGLAGSASVGAKSRLGGQVGVTDHAKIGRDVLVAAKSGVIGDIPDGAVVAGFPAVSRMRWLRAIAAFLDAPKKRSR